jgi:pheromone a factor receptor
MRCLLSVHSLFLTTATRIQVALAVALPASSLCINRLLYRVATMKSAETTDAENRRIVIIDFLIGVGIPALQMFLREYLAIRLLLVVYADEIEYVVAENRYNIFEDIGPFPSIWDTLPTFFLVLVWPVAIGAVSLFYCGEYS